MKNRIFEKLISEKLYCGLDFGAYHLKAAAINTMNSNSVELIDVVESPLFGMEDGQVKDKEKLVYSIRKCLQALSDKIDLDISLVDLGVGLDWIESRETISAIPIADRSQKVIQKKDVKKLIHHNRLLGKKVDERLLHSFELFYLIDDEKKTFMPEGLSAHKLAVKSVHVVSKQKQVSELINAVAEAGYEVGHVFLSSYAAAENILSDRDKKEGVALMDVGSKMTTLMTFANHRLQSFDILEYGGEDITQALTKRFRMERDPAEELKLNYVATHMYEDPKEDVLILKDGQYEPVLKESISLAMIPLIKNFAKTIKKRMKNSDGTKRLAQGMVMVGGGSLLPEIPDILSKELGMTVRVGSIGSLQKYTGHAAAIFSQAIGLSQCGFKNTLGYHLANKSRVPWLRGFSDRMRELYDEYF